MDGGCPYQLVWVLDGREGGEGQATAHPAVTRPSDEHMAIRATGSIDRHRGRLVAPAATRAANLEQ